MRIAFFGGSFDPPHRGHVAIAKAAADRLSLDRLLVAPVGRQPLKDGTSLANYNDRLVMAELAFAEDTRFEVSTLDAPRADGQNNYTYETLVGLKEELQRRDVSSQLYCLLGADSFHTLRHWHRSSELLLLCDFIIATRPGYLLREIGSRLPDGIEVLSETSRPDMVQVRLASVEDPARTSTVHVLTDLEENVSATALRLALASGDTTVSRTMLAAGVADYIHEHRLYGSD